MGLFYNYPLMSSMMSIFIAQFLKYLLTLLSRDQAHLNLLTSTGGMPSSHSAAVTGLITALGLQYGFDSPHVAVATTFGVIVLFDAMGVRRQSGHQGVLLNRLLNALRLENLSLLSVETAETKEIEHYKGHTPLEVLAGMLTGTIIAYVMQFIYFQ
ncbi:divergent PAP2 family protein [Atopobacter phocae]|uniref:divergent PAP2 family protein n=1 Tax=Atopobacter phocae TaxID=136492 RepID=UPI0004728D85|nr:divergent PAP2 family protein [Atopobacter phocae]